MGGTTLSSFGGQTRNPYDVLRTPGGSSGGRPRLRPILASSGRGDTGQSTRSPASATNVVGIRPTRGLVSRSGILPISSTQDEAGPLTRSVADAARMLAVMAGYDPDDPITAFGQRRKPHSYVSSLIAMGCAAPHWAAHGLDGDRGDPRGSQWRRAQRRAADGAPRRDRAAYCYATPHHLDHRCRRAASNSARRLTAIWPG